MNSKYVFVMSKWIKIACGSHLGFSQPTESKNLETTFSVFIEVKNYNLTKSI